MGVVERKNHTLKEMDYILLHAIPLYFSTDTLNTAFHIHNHIQLRRSTLYTNYQLWEERKPNVKYFHVFGSLCYILYDREFHQKWDSTSDGGIFLKYSTSIRAFRVFNKRTKTIL